MRTHCLELLQPYCGHEGKAKRIPEKPTQNSDIVELPNLHWNSLPSDYLGKNIYSKDLIHFS